MAPGTDPAFDQAMDNLMTQVNVDNILAVHQAFQQKADDLNAALHRARIDCQVGLCGSDPISVDAAAAFNDKVGQLLDVHWRHWEELTTVASLLRATARSYGKTEAEISSTFSAAAPR